MGCGKADVMNGGVLAQEAPDERRGASHSSWMARQASYCRLCRGRIAVVVCTSPGCSGLSPSSLYSVFDVMGMGQQSVEVRVFDGLVVQGCWNNVFPPNDNIFYWEEASFASLRDEAKSMSCATPPAPIRNFPCPCVSLCLAFFPAISTSLLPCWYPGRINWNAQ